MFPYVLAFAGVLPTGETLWCIGLHCLNRVDARGIEDLYVIGMDELFAKDAAFLLDNFVGSLIKRVLSFGARSEKLRTSAVRRLSRPVLAWSGRREAKSM